MAKVRPAGGFWAGLPPAARLTGIATLILVAVGLGGFVAFTAMISAERGISPAAVIFGPMPGNPMITWLYYFGPAMVWQGAVALALGSRWRGLRIAGIVGAFAVVAFCLVWFGAVIFGGINWLLTGKPLGDLGDTIGIIVLGIPLGLAIGWLNARAIFLTLHELRAHPGVPRPNLLPT